MMPKHQKHLISIWRPEATAEGPFTLKAKPAPQNWRKAPLDPFDGIETYVMPSEEAALVLADKLADRHPDWKFHIESASAWQGECPCVEAS